LPDGAAVQATLPERVAPFAMDCATPEGYLSGLVASAVGANTTMTTRASRWRNAIVDLLGAAA
jgi:hypothetical protein